MISKFFIDRPIFASVLSIVITLAGGIALMSLPIAMFPSIAPPTVNVTANYPGASAQVVAETVAVPIEQQVNGVENMMYMSSQCTNDGTYTLTVTFKHGVNLNMAQVLVQNRVSLALPQLPDVLKQTGVDVRKQSPDILMALAINSPSGRYDQLYLSNYAILQMRDEIARMPGVSEVRILGQRDYSMRIWVDPEKLAARDMEAGDVARAIREQNLQVATGQVGQQPMSRGQVFQVPLSTLGRLTEVEQFEAIVVKSGPEGRKVRLKDVARVELGAKNSDLSCKVNGKPSVSLAIFQLPDANALDVAVAIKAKVAEMKEKDFPEGMEWEVRYDTTPFISESILEVFKTLREAILLVAVVVLLFLQNWRSAVIPLVAVPVAIVGTFAAMAALGFSLNNLTLFGLVLAIGIVVDDAIVVVEAVEHHIEHGMAPREATVRAMEEVSGPVVAIGLVLTAVFVPCAFITGIVGQFFRQFALTIAVSTVISTFNSLTLSPALAALLLKPRREGQKGGALPKPVFAAIGAYLGYAYLAPWVLVRLEHAAWAHSLLAALGPRSAWAIPAACAAVGAVLGWPAGGPLDQLLTGFFRLFNLGFKKATWVYGKLVGGLLRVSVVVLVVYGGLLYLTSYEFKNTPTGFIPSQDMGYLLINVQLPDSTSDERTRAVMDKLERIAKATKGVKHTQTIAGQSLLLSANGSNFGSMFVILDPFEFRRTPNLYGEAIQQTLRKYFTVGIDEKRIKELPTEMLQEITKEGEERWIKGPYFGVPMNSPIFAEFREGVPEGVMTVLGPPPVRGVGRAGGFKFMVEDREDVSSSNQKILDADAELAKLDQLAKAESTKKDAKPDTIAAPSAEPKKKELPARRRSPNILQDQAENLAEQAGKIQAVPGKPALVSLVSIFRANVPQIFVDVNRTECMRKMVPLRDLFSTMQIYLGSLYVNDFNLFGRTWQVVVQAEPRFRNQWEDVRRLKVRNQRGSMVPVGSLVSLKETPGPLVLMRYNLYPAAPIQGAAGPGVSSGQAIGYMEEAARQNLLSSMSFEWTELAYLEQQAGNTAMYVFATAVVLVFLLLAALYESWSMPLAIILVVPMCLLSAVVGIQVGKQDINIFSQIGFVVLVGLASKNAILIVEFAKQRRDSGETARQAALEACTLRLRPIIMTSLAFILGVVPLILGHGAGAEMRRTLGITVFSGMLGVTLFGIVLTPVFFFVIDRLGDTKVFRSSAVRRFGKYAIYAMSLGLVPAAHAVPGAVLAIRRRALRGGKKKDPLPELEPVPSDLREYAEQE